MGVLDFIKPKSALEKASKNLREPYAQPDVRQTAMDKLFEIGTEEAYANLLERFSFNANGHTADEAEKRMLVERLSDVGEPVRPALENYIATKKTITYPIEALRGMVPAPEAKDFLKSVLAKYEPQDHRSTQAKATLVVTLGEMLDRSEADVLVPYLHDHSDDVQFQTIAALEHLGNPDVAPALAEVCTSEEHAPRIQRRAAAALQTMEVSVRGKFESFASELKDEYMIDKKGRLQKKTGAAS